MAVEACIPKQRGNKDQIRIMTCFSSHHHFPKLVAASCAGGEGKDMLQRGCLHSPTYLHLSGSFWHADFATGMLKMSTDSFMFCKPLCFQVSWGSWGEPSPWFLHCSCWALWPLLVSQGLGLGCCQKHPGTVCRGTAERRCAVRPEVPFLHDAVKPHVADGPWLLYEAACCPRVSQTSTSGVRDWHQKGVTDKPSLDFIS